MLYNKKYRAFELGCGDGVFSKTISNVKQMLEKERFSIQQAELIGCKMKSVLITAKNIKYE